ncbi:MAG: type II toxin-antitoxin system death-on-curing family toxin [Candidatus Methanoperedens sp.]
MLRNPIVPLKLLTVENILDINKELKEDSLRDPKIEYSGIEDYPVQIYKIKALVKNVPIHRPIFELAAYYLKNIILLQAFPDGNHRTALYASELFLNLNGYSFDYTPEKAYEFRKELYNRRLREYKTYEERPICILKEKDNQTFSLCLEFVMMHSAEST